MSDLPDKVFAALVPIVLRNFHTIDATIEVATRVVDVEERYDTATSVHVFDVSAKFESADALFNCYLSDFEGVIEAKTANFYMRGDGRLGFVVRGMYLCEAALLHVAISYRNYVLHDAQSNKVIVGEPPRRAIDLG